MRNIRVRCQTLLFGPSFFKTQRQPAPPKLKNAQTLISVLALSIFAVLGCSKTDPVAEVASSEKQDSPAKVVAEFLEAVRVGNTQLASSKLTPLALQRMKEEETEFAPPASETTRFRVGEIEMFEADKAFVDSVLIEQGTDGKPYEENMTWGLRLTDAGWRISGMAADMGPNEPPVLLNFENPGQFLDAVAPVSPGQEAKKTRQAMRASRTSTK